jgi:hypothetical protein
MTYIQGWEICRTGEAGKTLSLLALRLNIIITGGDMDDYLPLRSMPLETKLAV